MLADFHENFMHSSPVSFYLNIFLGKSPIFSMYNVCVNNKLAEHFGIKEFHFDHLLRLHFMKLLLLDVLHSCFVSVRRAE